MDVQPVPGKGRAHLIALALAKRKEQEAAKANAPPEAEPPKPRGRAALIQHFAKQRSSQVGASVAVPSAGGDSLSPTTAPSPSTTSVTEVTEKLKDVDLETEKSPCHYKGETGKLVPSSANYIRLNLEPGRGIYEFEVKFEPEVDSKSARGKLLNIALAESSKAKTFDGKTLYLPEKVIETRKEFVIEHPFSKESITLTIIYKKQKKMSDCLHLYNVLFKRIMYILEFKRVGRQFFDNRDPCKIPQHKLEIWPGYCVSVNEYSGGIMLCLDVQHKVLRTQTALQVMQEAAERNKQRAKSLIEKEFIGSVVLTKYNNKTYVVHDVVWDSSPKSEFVTSDGGTISFADYYQKQYNLQIRDMEQPLLAHRQSVTISGQTEKQDRLIMLVPELSYMTGLQDEMRSNFKVMKDVAQFTRVTPNQRVNSLRKFIGSINRTPEAKEVLAAWGLSLATASIDLQMRILGPEDIIFGNGAQFHGTDQADWTSAAMRNPVMVAIDLRNWAILYTSQDKKNTDEFVKIMRMSANKMGTQISPPNMICVPDDRTETYMKLLQSIINPSLQIVCIICPTSRDDRYMTIKKITCAKNPVPSQVINSCTLRNPKRLQAIVQKIALQINCKLGGSLWSVRFPFTKWMVCGIDVHHSKTHSGQAVVGFVSSVTAQMSKYYSRVCFHEKDKELSDHLKVLFANALQEYYNLNGHYPEKVVIFRDGIGDGQMEACRQMEINQLLSIIEQLGIPTKLIFIVVQKRISTRLFMQGQNEYVNPPPGSILDTEVTRKYLYDFFLVSQNVRQGTVSPTHYVVLFDNANIKPDNIQRLTYKMCHMYYNWTGTVRVPAPCQYAHKLAYLVGTCVRQEHSPTLAHKLFYL